MHVWVYLLECDWSTEDHNFKRSSTFSLSSHQQSVAPQITSAPTHAGVATVLILWRSATGAMNSWGQQSCYPLCFCLPVLLELKKQVTADHLSTWKHSFLPLGHISQQNKNISLARVYSFPWCQNIREFQRETKTEVFSVAWGLCFSCCYKAWPLHLVILLNY